MGAARCCFLQEGSSQPLALRGVQSIGFFLDGDVHGRGLHFVNGDEGSHGYFYGYSRHTMGKTPRDLRLAAGASAFGRHAVHLNLALFSSPYPGSSVLQRSQGHSAWGSHSGGGRQTE